MAEAASLDLLDKHLVTDQLVLTVGYDIESLTNPSIAAKYNGPVTSDYYGRQVPKHAHGTANLDTQSSSRKKIRDAVMELYDRIVNPDLLVRRLNLTTNHVISEEKANNKRREPIQLDLFTDYDVLEKQKAEEEAELAKERKIQEAILKIKKQFGKNALLTGLNFADGATAKERNAQIGGHKA